MVDFPWNHPMIFSPTKTIQQIHDEMKEANNEFIQELNLVGLAYMRCAFLISKYIDTLLPAQIYSWMVVSYYEDFFLEYINYAKTISISIDDNNNEISNQCQTLIMETNKKIETAYPNLLKSSE